MHESFEHTCLQAANHRHLFKQLKRRIERMDGAYDDYRDDPAARAALHADLHALVDALMGKAGVVSYLCRAAHVGSYSKGHCMCTCMHARGCPHS